MNAVGKCVTGMHRKNNEDAIFVSDGRGPIKNLYIVADGMGGHNAGEVASNGAIDTFTEYLDINCKGLCAEDEILDLLVGGVQYTNSVIFEKSEKEEKLCGMGTTFVAAAICSKKLFVAHVGDSRLYIYREGILRQITHDHSYVMEMVKQGKITKEEAINHPQKNVITKALGTTNAVEPDTILENLNEKDILLMCSDGLSNMLIDDEIKQILSEDKTLEVKVDELVNMANAKGGLDNISIIIIEQEVSK